MLDANRFLFSQMCCFDPNVSAAMSFFMLEFLRRCFALCPLKSPALFLFEFLRRDPLKVDHWFHSVQFPRLCCLPHNVSATVSSGIHSFSVSEAMSYNGALIHSNQFLRLCCFHLNVSTAQSSGLPSPSASNTMHYNCILINSYQFLHLCFFISMFRPLYPLAFFL